MFKKLHGVKTLTVGIALVAGLLAGTVVVANSQSGQDITSAPVFQVNQNGEKYGSLADVNIAGQEPDLVKAVGVDGTLGYVKRTDLEQPLPKTPQEAVALMKHNSAHPTREILLYDVDGKTVIGKFIVGGGTVKEFKTSEEMQKFEKEQQISPN